MIKTLLVNLHAGQVARRPVRRVRGRRPRAPLSRLLRTHKPDVAFLTEVRSLSEVRRAAPGYVVTGAMRGSYECVAILIREKTMALRTAQVHHVTDQRDRMHPARAFPVVAATHRASGEVITLIGVHLWAMGDAWRSPDRVIKGHVDQTHEVVSLAEGAKRVLAGGDWNEDLDDPDDHGQRTAPAILGDAGLSLASRKLNQHAPTSLEGKSLLDDVASKGMTAQSRRTLPNPGGGADHHPVVTVHSL